MLSRVQLFATPRTAARQASLSITNSWNLLKLTSIESETDNYIPLERYSEGKTEDKMVGWHYGLNGHEFEQVPGVGDGQGSLACCSPWDCEE